ncbi:DUF6894 family protein [Muricoccus radiodurans]|uniref:DUF6894 family protein n=1 Tax=Muricoccus radiodurans TaxID=2231721 RepID=UPI003CF72BA6
MSVIRDATAAHVHTQAPFSPEGRDQAERSGRDRAGSLETVRREALQRLPEMALSPAEQPWVNHVWQVDVTDDVGLLQFSLMLTGTDAPSVHSWSAVERRRVGSDRS